MSNKKFAVVIAAISLVAAGVNMTQPLIGTVFISFVGGMGYIYIRSE